MRIGQLKIGMLNCRLSRAWEPVSGMEAAREGEAKESDSAKRAVELNCMTDRGSGLEVVDVDVEPRSRWNPESMAMGWG